MRDRGPRRRGRLGGHRSLRVGAALVSDCGVEWVGVADVLASGCGSSGVVGVVLVGSGGCAGSCSVREENEKVVEVVAGKLETRLVGKGWQTIPPGCWGRGLGRGTGEVGVAVDKGGLRKVVKGVVGKLSSGSGSEGSV